jgi:hypothetical protein
MVSKNAKPIGVKKMSKVFIAISEGRAKEFKAVVNGAVRFVVELDGRFYSRFSDRYLPLAKNKITPYIELSGALQ